MFLPLAVQHRTMSDSSAVTIEQPTMGDLDVLVDLWVALAGGQRAFGSHLEPEANRDRIRESIARGIALSEIHVARLDGALVGFAMYTIEGSTFERSATRGLVQNLYVVPDHRGEGIGGRLLAAAERTLEADGADVVGLDVLADNDDAIEFYRRHGYTPHRYTLEKPTENDTS